MHQVLTEGGRKLNHEPAGSQTTNDPDVDLPDKPRVLEFDPFFRPRARTEATNRSRYEPSCLIACTARGLSSVLHE